MNHVQTAMIGSAVMAQMMVYGLAIALIGCLICSYFFYTMKNIAKEELRLVIADSKRHKFLLEAIPIWHGLLRKSLNIATTLVVLLAFALTANKLVFGASIPPL